MDETIQTHVTAIETAFVDAEAFAAGLPDGPVKDGAVAALKVAHAAAYAEWQAFIAAHGEDEAVQGVALRGGGTDK